ncbi:MAG: MotA/TolQ/ExbB proton channel family protein [Calditrichaeota bacterium]|nr:MotA/TolQ/ExbB proton channel family protein [Calditrichota bacterium]
MSVFSVLAKGGWLMIFIAIFSLIAVGIFIERLMVLRKAKINLNAFLIKIRQYIGKKDYDNALLLCSRTPGPISKVIEKGIRLRGQSREEIKDAIESAGRTEIYQLEKGFGALATIAGVAPLTGFLGTVTGMIQAFMRIQELGGNVNASVLAGGIWEALITTAAGLLVGILTLLGYNYLVTKVQRLVFELEVSSTNLLEMLTGTELKQEKPHEV